MTWVMIAVVLAVLFVVGMVAGSQDRSSPARSRGFAGPGVAATVTPRLVIGIAVILVGVLFTLDNLGLIRARDFLRYWPVIVMAVGVARLAQSQDRSGVGAGLVWLAVGAWLLLESLDLLNVSFSRVWPLLLVLAGGYIAWQALSGGGHRHGAACREDTLPVAEPRADLEPPPPPVPLPPRRGTGDDRITALAFLSGVERSSYSRDFKGADLTAVMGGCEVDLRGASIASGLAIIDVFAFWGGVEIKVPENWTVSNKVFPFMGGFGNHTRPPRGDTTQHLVIRGLVFMGGGDVKN